MSVEWKISDTLISYTDAIRFMEDRVESIINGEKAELIWLLEHPPIYTSGTSSEKKDLFNQFNLPVFEAKRGGQYTFHGPGQRVVYVMLDLNKRGKDVRKFVKMLEAWIINVLSTFDLDSFVDPDRIGVWVDKKSKITNLASTNNECKIAAIGIRLKKWVSFHGLSINVNPDLKYFSGIVPCGISDYGVTSFEDLGHTISMNEIDLSLKRSFKNYF